MQQTRDILLKTLKNFWGYDSFRDNQEEIIFSVLDRKDTLALLPTGGGKSLCYQLPALVQEGTCIVVSPLLALMKDQVNFLKSIGVEAEYISAELEEVEQEEIYERAIYGDIKLLYVSPERLSNALFLRNIINVGISFIAVDEAHCISEWGQDFRPSYQNIIDFRKVVGDLPCIALTATATAKVIDDIKEKLGLSSVNVFRKSFRRYNMHIYHDEVSDKYKKVLNFLEVNPLSGIIYVRTRREAEDLTNFLKSNNINNVDYYHSGLSVADKKYRHKIWQERDDYVLISTNAFGMGIDKDNVRFVIHYSPPISIENYYQEIGRAGRDEKESYTFLYWNKQELSSIDDIIYSQIPNKEEFIKIVSYVYSHFYIAEGEIMDIIFQLDINKIVNFTKISYAKIKSTLKFLHNQEVIYWNNYNSPSSLELKISVEDIDNIAPKDSYYLEFLFRNLPGLNSQKVYFNEKKLANKLGVSYQDLQDRIKYLAKNNLVEYIDGSADSIKFLRHRNDREIRGKYWNLFEKIQKNKIQKWEEMKYFLQDSNYCKMKMILAYFGEKNIDNCNRCNVCTSDKDIGTNYLEKEILHNLKIKPMTFEEIKVKMFSYQKELIFETLITMLNIGKIKMLDYKTYMINE